MRIRELLCVLVAVVATEPAFAQTVACNGTESGGAGATSYEYPVVDTAGSMTDLYIATEDGNAANYVGRIMPPGWTFAIVANPAGAPFVEPALADDQLKTAHGAVNGAVAPGVCPYLIHFSGPAGLPGGAFNFGFNHPWISHDVEWQTIDAAGPTNANWGAAVGGGAGPVHAPHCATKFPDAGDDVFESDASFKILFLDGREESCTGLHDQATVVHRSDPFMEADPADQDDEPCLFPTDFPESPATRWEVHTEITSLNLVGADCVVRAGTTYLDSPVPPPVGFYQSSLGEVASQDDGDPMDRCDDFPADSFFDVYVQVVKGGQEFYNLTPMVVRATLTQFPPDLSLPETTYIHDPTFPPVPLFNRNGNHVAYLLSAGHGHPQNLSTFDCVQTTPLIAGPVTFGVDDATTGLNPGVVGPPPNHVWDDQAMPEKVVTAYQSSGGMLGATPDTTNARIPELVGLVEDPDLPPDQDFIAGDAINSFSFGRDGTHSTYHQGDQTPGNLFFSVTRTVLDQADGCDNAVDTAEKLNSEAADIFASGVGAFGAYADVVNLRLPSGTNVLVTGALSLGLSGGTKVLDQDNVIALEIDEYDAEADSYYLTLAPFAATTSLDCNGNYIADQCDIANQTSDDINQNGVPDECEFCPGYTPTSTPLDCNGNSIRDECDLSCAGQCAIDYPGDCDAKTDVAPADGIPDDCQSCVFPTPSIQRTAVIYLYENQSDPGPYPLCDLAVFATPGDMGLVEEDIIDALVLSDRCSECPPQTRSPNGIADPNLDEVLFSLAPGSPTLVGLGASAADVFYSDLDTTFSLFASAADLGLTEEADLDAADIGPTAPVGACYEPEGSDPACVEMSVWQCKGCGWHYDGDNTECQETPPKPGACCLNHEEPPCVKNTQAWCEAKGGYFRGGGTCWGDNDGDGCDDACPCPTSVPTISGWGFALLLLLMVTTISIVLRRFGTAGQKT